MIADGREGVPVRDRAAAIFGLLFPANTPRERIDLIYLESKAALDTPELKRVIDTGGFYAVGSSPAEFGRLLKSDYEFQGSF